MLADAFVIVLAVFAVRVAVRLYHDPDLLRNPFPLDGYVGDGMTHLVMTEAIRHNGGRIPHRVDRFLLDRPCDYPMLFHAIHALVPRAKLERFEWAVCPFWEGVHAGLVFVAATFIAGEGFGHGQPEIVGLMTAAGVFLTPLLMREPSRAVVYGERPFGFMAADMALCGVVLFSATGQAAWLAIVVAATAVTLASSKFALQALVFVSAGIALIRFDPMPVLLVGAALALAILATGGYGWRVLRGSLRHSNLYRTWIVHVHTYTRELRNSQLVRALALLAARRPGEAWQAFRRHPLSGLLWVPWLIPFGWSATVAIDGSPELVGWLVAWAFAAVLVMAVVLSERLKFLGEAERYLEYALLPMACLSAMAALDGGVAAVLWGLVFAGCVVRLLIAIPGASMPVRTPDVRELIAFLEQYPRSTLLAIPGRLCFPIAYRTDHRLLWVLANFPAEPELSILMDLIGPAGRGRYPYVRPEQLPVLQSRYGVDLIVVSKPDLRDAERLHGIRYCFAGWPELYRNASYAVLEPPRVIAEARLPASIGAVPAHIPVTEGAP